MQVARRRGLRFVAAYLDNRVEFLNSDDDADIVHGELGDPEMQINYRGTVSFQNWEMFLEARWIDEMYIEEQELRSHLRGESATHAAAQARN